MTAAANPGAFPTVPGQPSYSGVFIPIIWSTKFLIKYYKNTIFTDITNTDYEGEIRNFGDTVYIPLVPDMIIHDYTDGQDLEIDRPKGDNIEFPIRKGQYFNAMVTDIANKQSNIPFLDKWSDDASRRMSIRIDRRILSEVPADVSIYNSGTTAGKISQNLNLGTVGSSVGVNSSNAVEKLFELNQALSEQDVPMEGRFFVLPPWYCRKLKESTISEVRISGDSESPKRSGYVGRIDGVGNIYETTNLPPNVDGADTTYYVLAGTPDAVTFASQMTNMETLRAQNTFGDLMRGLQVFDYKVIKPEALATLYCKEIANA